MHWMWVVVMAGLWTVAAPADVPVVWQPNPGPQTVMLMRQEFEVLTGGSRFGGKTEGQLAWFSDPVYVHHPGYKALMVRRNQDDLSDWVERARVWFRRLGGRVTGRPPVVRFPQGGFIRTGHFKDESAWTKYLGHEYQKIGIEELTLIPTYDQYEKLCASCRSTIPELRPQVLSTTNPGEVGHLWVKSYFVDVCRNRPYYDPATQRWRIFIPSLPTDNPIGMAKDPEYVPWLEGIKDPKLRAAWRYGDWNSFVGQYFSIWNAGVHVVAPFDIPREWLRFRGMDWGHRDPAAVGWVAVDPAGVHYLYRELYEPGHTPTQLAQIIHRMTGKENILRTVASPDIWAKNQYGVGPDDEQATVEAIVNHFERAGLYLEKANNDRINGWMRLKELLYWDRNLPPNLRIFSNCTETIRTLPGLPHKKSNPEDVDDKPGIEDHLAEMLRYICMHTLTTPVGVPRQDGRMVEVFDRLARGPRGSRARF